MDLIMREDSRNGGHVDVSVWIGDQPGSRALAGRLTFRVGEWDDLRVPAAGGDHYVIARAT